MTLFLIVIFSLLGSVGVIATASFFITAKEKLQKLLVDLLISFATGTLLASAFLGLIPNTLESLPAMSVLSTALAGILIFFLIEKFVIWHHCHDRQCQAHKSAGPMILVGDAFHNFIDGVVIAASFLISIPVGIAVSISIVVHEIPQELGDFAILLHSGYPKKKALLFNVLSGLVSLPAAIIAYFALSTIEPFVPYVLAIAAASFIYIALTDLSPQLHQKTGLSISLRQILFMLAGILTIVCLLNLMP